MIFFLFAFVFTLPLWMFGIPLYLAAAIRQRYPGATTLSAALVIGVISTITSLAYRQCQIGTWYGFDQAYPAKLAYRGFPFGWVGWSLFDLSPQPMGLLFGDLLIWTVVTFGALSLFSLVQVQVQLKVARADKILITGVIIALLPLLIAAIADGHGC